jgi:dTDP-4-amino-4,6-dideoxygalactose transaminase
MKTPFNKPFIAGRELDYIAQAVKEGNIGGDGRYTQLCSRLLEERFDIPRVLLTPSCTAALEMAVTLCEIEPGDEVIMPSFTFVSTASAVARAGAVPVFVDIRPDTLNMDEERVEAAISPKTRAILPVHYAGVGCEMERIASIARAHGLRVIEDAAHGVAASYRGQALGSIGDLGTYSFHETKNYICGEGGALCINDPTLIDRAEIIRDKGTNRQRFVRGEVDKYTWVDIGSSYVPSEIVSAFLYGQLELLDSIAERRRLIHARYAEWLAPLEEEGLCRLPRIPGECESNFHMFYVLLRDQASRDGLIAYLKERGIQAVFLRLPFFYEIGEDEQGEVAKQVGACLRAQRGAA